MSDHERIYKLLLTYIPHLENQPGHAVDASRMIKDWLDAGADPDLDIIPTINKQWTKTPTGKRIGSPRYFDTAVKTAHHQRISAAETKAKTEETRIRSFASKRKYGIFLPSYEQAALDKWESERGPVTV